ncbi:replication initiator protein A [Halobacillus litoralis]|uniref:replication initiator protein A n=1 Tax=Halobacillus litoralis TaxID=45668 RepID=UPI001CFC577B|nr:replication initiator protein A [Halobacillus litoralis]
MSRYYTESDTPNIIFYRVPKVLILSERYKKMKPNALKLYIVLLDRLQLSMQNHWIDENGYYVRMSKEHGSDLLNISEPTFITSKKELHKLGLIEEKRVGLNKANLIYVLKVDYSDEDLYKIKKVDAEMLEGERKLKNLTFVQMKIQNKRLENRLCKMYKS